MRLRGNLPVIQLNHPIRDMKQVFFSGWLTAPVCEITSSAFLSYGKFPIFPSADHRVHSQSDDKKTMNLDNLLRQLI